MRQRRGKGQEGWWWGVCVCAERRKKTAEGKGGKGEGGARTKQVGGVQLVPSPPDGVCVMVGRSHGQRISK